MNDHFEIINKIADEILKDKDNAKAIEFTKVIGTLLRENGVTPICTEYVADGCFDNKLGFGYKCCFEKLDFSEHDKVFEDKIAKLEKQIKSYEAERKELRTRCCMDSAREKFDNHSYGGLVIYTKNFTSECERRLYDENQELKQRIAELESKESEVCKNEPKISDSTPSMEWYENRHQSDCIEINRLNTTIDVLIHKVEYLRQFAGLE